MEITVKNSWFVLEIVFSMKLLVNVYALSINFGMDFSVWSNLNVVVGKDGIRKHSSANVLIISIGMEQLVSFA